MSFKTQKPTILVVASLVIGFCAGFFIHVLGAFNRPPAGGICNLTTVKIDGNDPQAQWLNNYSVSYVPLRNIESESKYAILLLVPKVGASNSQAPKGIHRLTLEGRPGETSYWLELTGGYFNSHPGDPKVILLDYINGSFPEKSVEHNALILRTAP